MWDNEGFGQEWDKKGGINEDVIAGPIKDLVEGELRAHGIDPERRADVSESAVDAFAGAILDGPAGTLAELVGYTAAAPTDTGKPGLEPGEKLDEALTLAAAGIATEVLRTRVDKVTWDDVCFEVKDTLDAYGIDDVTADEAAHLVGDAIGRANYNCMKQWTKVYRIARKEAGLQDKSD